MVWSINVTPRGKSIAKVLDMFAKADAVFVKDIQRAISKSSFYDSLLPLIDTLNEQIEERRPGMYFIRPEFKRDPVSGRYVLALRRNGSVQVRRLDGLFEIRVRDV